jgi:hypothetical protein
MLYVKYLIYLNKLNTQIIKELQKVNIHSSLVWNARKNLIKKLLKIVLFAISNIN